MVSKNEKKASDYSEDFYQILERLGLKPKTYAELTGIMLSTVYRRKPGAKRHSAVTSEVYTLLKALELSGNGAALIEQAKASRE